MNPRMVDQVIGARPVGRSRRSSDTEFGRALDADTRREMVAMMVANVNDGAASGARIDGVDVGGKTGTAENGEDQPYTLWFTGFAPADNPQVAVAVVVEDGGGQGQIGQRQHDRRAHREEGHGGGAGTDETDAGCDLRRPLRAATRGSRSAAWARCGRRPTTSSAAPSPSRSSKTSTWATRASSSASAPRPATPRSSTTRASPASSTTARRTAAPSS